MNDQSRSTSFMLSSTLTLLYEWTLSTTDSAKDLVLALSLSLVRNKNETPDATPAIMQKIVIGIGLGNSAKMGASIEASLATKLQRPKVVEE